MTARKILIEITELKQGGFVAMEQVKFDELKPEKLQVVKNVTPIYAERLSLTPTGLTGRLHKRLVDYFKKEG